MSTSNLGHSGAFRLSTTAGAGTGTWTWSEQTYELYGFRPGDVVPSTELVLAHQHPEDRGSVEAFLLEVVERGRPGSVWHRLVDAQGVTRQVVTTVVTEVDADGAVVAVTGHTVDVSEAVRRTTAREVGEAMEVLSQSRPPIEQAKGALMLRYALDADQAFTLLRDYSQLVNVKVREVARLLLASVTAGAGLPATSRADLDRLAAALRAPRPAEADA